MILRLNGADFSQKNIGHIDFKRELSSETTLILSNFSKSLTDAQKFAVQDFIKKLKDENVWSHIENLYIPILAGKLNECGYNIKSNTKDLTFGTDYVLNDKGLKLNPVSTNYWDTSTKLKINGSQQNLHLGAFNTDSFDGMTQTDAILGCHDAVSGGCIQLGVNSAGDLSLKTDNNTKVVIGSTRNDDWESPSLKMIVQSTLGNFAILSNTVGEYGTPISTDNTYTDIKVNLFNIASVWRETYSHYGLITTGSAITREQASTYVEAVNTFMSNFI